MMPARPAPVPGRAVPVGARCRPAAAAAELSHHLLEAGGRGQPGGDLGGRGTTRYPTVCHTNQYSIPDGICQATNVTCGALVVHSPLVVPVPGGLQLERRVLHVEMVAQAELQLVEDAGGVVVPEAGVVHDHVGGENR